MLQVNCETNDWITIPAGTRHWFDMGSHPNYCVLRFFKNAKGWIASFTDDPIADLYPGLPLAQEQKTQAKLIEHSVSSETVRRPLQAK